MTEPDYSKVPDNWDALENVDHLNEAEIEQLTRQRELEKALEQVKVDNQDLKSDNMQQVATDIDQSKQKIEDNDLATDKPSPSQTTRPQTLDSPLNNNSAKINQRDASSIKSDADTKVNNDSKTDENDDALSVSDDDSQVDEPITRKKTRQKSSQRHRKNRRFSRNNLRKRKQHRQVRQTEQMTEPANDKVKQRLEKSETAAKSFKPAANIINVDFVKKQRVGINPNTTNRATKVDAQAERDGVAGKSVEFDDNLENQASKKAAERETLLAKLKQKNQALEQKLADELKKRNDKTDKTKQTTANGSPQTPPTDKQAQSQNQQSKNENDFKADWKRDRSQAKALGTGAMAAEVGVRLAKTTVKYTGKAAKAGFKGIAMTGRMAGNLMKMADLKLQAMTDRMVENYTGKSQGRLHPNKQNGLGR